MKINIAKPDIGDEEIEAVSRVMRSGMIASGPETKKFEEEFAEYIGCKYACAVTNGTAAISVALSASGVGPGDEVITTPLTFVATANAILSCGATPVFADIEEKTFNLCPKSTEKAITNKTKAIMPVHIYGLPSNMTEFRKISEKYDLILIGDAAQAHGSEINGVKVGQTADLECFSFYPTKNMTTGEGGMVTTNSRELYHLVNSIRNHGRPSSTLGTYEYERFGLNVRLTDISSAIGRVQLKKLPEMNKKRAKNAEQLISTLSDSAEIILPHTPEGYIHSWHQFTIRVKDRAGLSAYLKENEIGVGIYYPRLVYDYSHLSKFKSNCVVAESLIDEVISLPVHPGLTSSDITKISQYVIKWINNKK